MDRFVVRTGVTGELRPARYLWTDAYAVCNLLGIARETESPEYLELARSLVDQAHRILGRHRADDDRSGWISGLGEDEGLRHPTAGGLRIGKELPERPAGEPVDTRLEWNRDGQYFHYLTKWAHALDLAARSTGEARYGAWGRELLQVAADRFIVAPPGGGLHMAWKMSIDLGRPLVSSMGHHDPLDGYVQCLALRAGALAVRDRAQADAMAACAAKLAPMIRRSALATADPLGIGGLLADACILAQLTDGAEFPDDGLLDTLLAAAAAGLHHYRGQGDLARGAGQRLAFRELGLVIGLHALPIIDEAISTRRDAFRDASGLAHRLGPLGEFTGLGTDIVDFWLRPEHRDSAPWGEHEDINEVMLATALIPGASLRLK